jgi:serine/threonine protein phosphatase PrpC
MSFDVATFSETGPRARNEDRVGVWRLPGHRIGLAVADGLGGHAGGEVASELAIRRLREALTANFDANLEIVAQTIHRELKDQQLLHPEWREMATTLSAVVIAGESLVGVHAGDTRVVISRGGGIRKLTEDHTEVQRLLLSKRITAEQARNYPRRNILDSALGIKTELRIDPIESGVRPGDRIFLSSDGVHDKILLRELLELTSRCGTASDVTEVVKAEMERRGPEDNYSLICCFVGE